MSNGDQIHINTFSPKWIFLISLGLGVIAGIANFVYFMGVGEQTITIYKANKTVKAGAPFLESDFDKVKIKGDIGELKNIAVTESNVGAYLNLNLAQTVNRGTPLLIHSFQITGEGGIRDSIGENERAVSIRVTEKTPDLRTDNVVDIKGSINGQKFDIANNVCIKGIGDSYIIPIEDITQRKYESIILFVPENNVNDFLTNVELSKDSIEFVLRGGKCGEPKREVQINKAISIPDKNNRGTQPSNDNLSVDPSPDIK